MRLKFYKYQGTGNDFIMLDNRSGYYNELSVAYIQNLCDRRFGIGADGLIRINASKKADFEVDYFNADGSKSFCGNGARCSVAFCAHLGIDVKNCVFDAIDGIHEASMKDNLIHLAMLPVEEIEEQLDDYVINTGSPHYIRFVDDVNETSIVDFGRTIRYSDEYVANGINVNCVEVISDNHIQIRTYERGVEDETLSCGTGATACAIAYCAKFNKIGKQVITVDVEGGKLEVALNNDGDITTDIFLIGPAEFVFEGEANV